MGDKKKVTNIEVHGSLDELTDEKDWTKKEQKEVLDYIKEELMEEEIPESLNPENMKKRLEEAEIQKMKVEKTRKMKKWTGILATAACLGILVTAGLHAKNFGTGGGNTATDSAAESVTVETNKGVKEEEAENQALYEQIYEVMNVRWAQMYPEPEEGYATGTMGGAR